MNAADRELFRHCIIAQLAVVGSLGLRTAALKNGLRAAGFEPTDADVDTEIQYLVDKGLVVECDKLLSPENKRWRITATGRDYAAQEGLA